MKFNTFSVCVGTEACNAKCPFCVAKMTEGFHANNRVPEFSKLSISSRFAVMNGVNTVLLTGKGEPTLFPKEIGGCLMVLKSKFPLIELQTNGLVFADKNKWRPILEDWSGQGLTHVALSIVHYYNADNGRIYCGADVPYEYPDLMTTIDFLVNLGFSVRLNCIGLKGYIDNIQKIKELLDFARSTGHELQVTWRPVTIPTGCDNDIAKATKELQVEGCNIRSTVEWLHYGASLLYKLPHGAEIFDVDGQNLCITNCLTSQPKKDVIRQLIYADGRLRYDWDKKGAIIL